MTNIISFADIDLGFELTSQQKHITQEVISKNAEASLDYNPVHIDPDFCDSINFLGKGTTISHGMMTLSFMGKIITDWLFPMGGYLKNLECKFIEAVRPGDTIKVHAKVVEKHPREKSDSFIVFEVYCDNQHGTKVSVGSATAIILN